MPRLFISCVSHEFASYRDAIRRDLSRPNLDTKIQEDFIAYGGATLEKLDEYIQHCEAVIHLCGDMTGATANELSIQYIQNKYPKFSQRFPSLKLEDLSYTQWEAYLAIFHDKRLFVATPLEGAARDQRYKKDEQQYANQKAHLERLKALGFYDEIQYKTEDELIKKLYISKLGDILNQIPRIKPISLPYQSIGNDFKGREGFNQELLQIFSEAKKPLTAIVIDGLGGIGKTRIAVEFARKHLNDYTAILFIQAGAVETFKSNIAHLSNAHILDLREQKATDEDEQYTAVVKWLNQYSNWLLIIDNADTTEVCKKIETFLSTLQHGNILITTRINTWSRQVIRKEPGVLHKDDAKAFLLETTDGSRINKETDNEYATIIADELGCLALALEQARAYIATMELSLEDYYKSWSSNRHNILAWFDEQQMQYPASVAITWQTSFNQLSDNATKLLNRLAWLASEPIPKSLLEVEIPDTKTIIATDAWMELKKYSLVTSTEDKTAFTVHRLVQEITRSRLDSETSLQTLTDSLNWIDRAFDSDPEDIKNWPLLEPLLPHVLTIIDFAQNNTINNPTSRLMNQAGVLFLHKALYISAEPLMRKSLQIDEETYGSDDHSVAVRLNNLAQLLQRTNRMTEAEPLMRRALNIDEKNFGSNDSNVGIRLNNLAILLQDTNRIQEAEPLMRRALQISEINSGPDHPNVAVCLNNLARLLEYTNRIDEAEAFMRRALHIYEEHLGMTDPSTATALNNLALLLKDTNRMEEAEPLMRKALYIDEQIYGPNHPNVARDLSNLALLLQKTNRIEESEELMRRSLYIDEVSLGSDHPNVAIRLNNLASLLKDTNRLMEAEPLMRKALQIDEVSLGPNHPNVSRDLNNLAQLLQDTNRMREAEPLMYRALNITEISFGSDHPKVAIRLSNLSLLLKDTNRLEKSEEFMRKAAKILILNFDLNHPNVQTVLGSYAFILQEMGYTIEKINKSIAELIVKTHKNNSFKKR